MYISASVLKQRLLARCDVSLLAVTRIHPLRTWRSPGGQPILVKREDESGWGVSGTKRRKYASLLPWLEDQQPLRVAPVGGLRSNNLPSLLQLLHERGIPATPVVKQPHGQPDFSTGNALLFRLLRDPAAVVWVSGEDWPRAEAFAAQHGLPIPEGGAHPAALAGAATLALEIIEQVPDIQHIWTEAGTGFTAAALVTAAALCQHPAQWHIVLTAGSEASFREMVTMLATEWDKQFGLSPPLPYLWAHVQVHLPATGRSFGSINAQIRDFVQELARTEGILADPVYTAKTFFTAQQHLDSGVFTGSHLIIHGGGGSGIFHL